MKKIIFRKREKGRLSKRDSKKRVGLLNPRYLNRTLMIHRLIIFFIYLPLWQIQNFVIVANLQKSLLYDVKP